MSYTVVLTKRAAKELADLPYEVITRLDQEIVALAENPRPPGCKKLKARFANEYRVRAGDYRILYVIDDQRQIVSVYRVGHRREVYE